MEQQRPPQISILKKIRDKFRYGLIFVLMRDYVHKIGIEITPFYWMKESIPEKLDPALSPSLNEFEFSFFGFEDVVKISKLPERQPYIAEKQIIDNFNNGKKCYGAKYKGEIAAFTWVGLDKTPAKYFPMTLKENEAYLFDMYVLKAFRGKNLAPLLRFKNYEVLKAMGRDTCYSMTVSFNTPAVKFKEKLNAQFVYLVLYINLFKKIRKSWILRKY